MMQVGMRVDLEKLQALSDRCFSLMQVEADKVLEITGVAANPNSDTQIRKSGSAKGIFVIMPVFTVCIQGDYYQTQDIDFRKVKCGKGESKMWKR